MTRQAVSESAPRYTVRSSRSRLGCWTRLLAEAQRIADAWWLIGGEVVDQAGRVVYAGQPVAPLADRAVHASSLEVR